MSNFFPSLVDDIGSLYSNIAQKDLELLNEDSDYYDQEVTEFVEDIISTISISMICERYSADAVLSFFANSTEEVILEKYFSVDKVYITESIVSDEYIQEQFEILDEGLGAALKVLGTGLKMGGKGLLQGVGTALKGAGRTVVTAVKRGIGPGGRKALGAASTKVKEIGSAAKAALTSPTAKNILKGAGIVGLGGVGGFLGAKLAGAGSGDNAKVGPKIVGPKIVGPKIVGPKSSSPSGGGGSNSSGGGGSSTPGKSKLAPTKPDNSDAKLTNMQKWAKANPTLAAKVKPGQSGYDEISAKRTKPGPYEKKDQTPTTGSTPAIPDLTSVNADLKKAKDPKELNKSAPANSALAKEQERRKREAEKAGKDAQAQTVNSSYEYDAYDLVLEYLLSQGHTDTIEEAHYVMMEMDAETIGSIVEAASDQSDKQIDNGVKVTYKAQNVLDNQHQGRSKGLNRLPRGEREEKAKRMRDRLKSRRDDLFGERNQREDSKRAELKKMLGF